jgi:hypothetical protein
LVTGGPQSSGGFNDGTVVRYNLFVNNKHHEIKTSGHASNTYIYNNTVYNRPTMTGIVIIWHKSWDGYSLDTRYYNNIFQVQGSGASVDLGGSGGNIFDYNVFYGAAISNEPADPHKLKLNPMFTRADSAGYGSDTITGYRLLKNSPAINSGMVVPGAQGKDIEGTPVPMYQVPDRGAFEYNGPYGISHIPVESGVSVFPNPASEEVFIRMNTIAPGPVTVRLFSITGIQLYENTFHFASQQEAIRISLAALHLKPGCYALKLDMGNGDAIESLLVIDK